MSLSSYIYKFWSLQNNDSAFADDEDSKESVKTDDPSEETNEKKLPTQNEVKNDTAPQETPTNKTDNVNNSKTNDTEGLSSNHQATVEQILTENKTENVNTPETIQQPEKQPDTFVNSTTQQNSANVFKGNDEDFEFSIDHITSMVANLGDDSDEEELTMNHQPVTSTQQNIDPSILYVKKAEPGKNINGLQDWIYRDPQGEIQGLIYTSIRT